MSNQMIIPMAGGMHPMPSSYFSNLLRISKEKRYQVTFSIKMLRGILLSTKTFLSFM
jgi:hypothetical protein